MKITLHQINTIIGDFEGNVSRITRAVEDAADSGSDLAVFPELAVTGYPPMDLLENADFIRMAHKALETLIRATSGLSTAVLVGTLVSSEDTSSGKPLNNAAVLIGGGEVRAIHRKVLLPTYDVFDERRHFEPGDSLTVAELMGARIALSICEDVWNDKTYWTTTQYRFDPVEGLLTKHRMPLINIAASPFSRGKGTMRREMLANIARRYSVPVLYVNQVGGNDSLVFDGRSMVLNHSGDVVALAEDFTEQVITVDLSNLPGDSVAVPDMDDTGTLFDALVTGLRDYAVKCGFSSAVLGLSGGIDSSLTAVIAVEALGPGNVLGILMPSPYTSKACMKDARSLAANLGIDTKTIPITGIYDRYLNDLKDGLNGLPGDVTEENIQARIRGNILMAMSNRFGHLVLSTGNKSELAVGYCTMYGDMSGGLAVISDLYKSEVNLLSSWINRKSEIIPESVLTREPTAELRPDQQDSDSLPPYDLLDPIIKAYIEDHKPLYEIVEMGYDEKLVRSILNLIDGNEYKRRQAAPGIKVTWKAFGLGRRCPIAKSALF